MCRLSAPAHDTKCTHQAEQESIFRTVFAWWLRFEGIFRRRRLKKGRQLFRQKVHPPRQNPGYAYAPGYTNRHGIALEFWRIKGGEVWEGG